MNVIVSKSTEDRYQNFVVVDTFKKVRELKGVDILIIHDFKEEPFEVGVFVSEFKKGGIEKFIYINSNPIPNVCSTLYGIKGKVIDDEFYLEDEEELMALIEELDFTEDETSALAIAHISVIEDFVSRFEAKDEAINAPLYLEQVREAINQTNSLVLTQKKQLLEMGASAIETFQKASTIIANIAKQRTAIEERLNEMEQKQGQVGNTRQLGGNILFYPTYKYMGVPKMLFIREYAPCRYLTSFILAYEHYLHYTKNKRVKLVFVHQKGAGVAKKYSDFTVITQESMGMDSLYDAEIIATNNPKAEVMKKLFSRPTDVFIVVDRLYGQQDIVSGRLAKLSAVSGKSDIKRFGLDAKTSIFPVTSVDDSFLTLFTIKQYPDSVDTRRAAYAQVFRDKFAMIDNFLQLPSDK